jgi:CheY-like chemotaxis protein
MTTRHIPISVLSTDEACERALSTGAVACIAKPIQRGDVLDDLLQRLGHIIDTPGDNVLLIEPDSVLCKRILESAGDEDLRLIAASDEQSARQCLQDQEISCMVASQAALPMVHNLIQPQDITEAVFTRMPLIIHSEGSIDETMLKGLSDTYFVRQSHSPERLLDLVSLSLHRNVAKLPDAWKQKLISLHQSDKLLAGKKVLIVDDDTRNIFALTSVLEDYNMVIFSADNGRDAIRILRQEPEVDIVLMDIMMPEMDGIETIREIRKLGNLKNLPIIAVTAKAMKGDREKCIEAGAWDYLSKPVDTQQMLAVLRAWLHR